MINMAINEFPIGQTLPKLMNVWVCENQQGYQDQVIFAFDSLHPCITFMTEGSVIKPFVYQQILKDKNMKNLPDKSQNQDISNGIDSYF